MIGLARDVVEGRRSPDDRAVEENRERSYHAYGHLYFEDLPINVDVAICASRKALLAACGHAPFPYLERVALIHGGGRRTYGPELTDEHRGNLEVGDAAASGALAYSCRADSSACDAQKLQEFWRWWLYKALPDAWRRAQAGAQAEDT